MPQNLPYRVDDLERRIAIIEKGEPAVQAERLKVLSEEVKLMKRAFWALVIAIVTSSLTLTAAALAGAFHGG